MKIIVVGCGRTGSDLAKLLSQNGHVITVIDRNPAAFEALGAHFKGRTIEGVGFDRDVLLAAGIERADGLAAVTSHDEANIVTAQLARQVFRVPTVIARLNEPRSAEIYRRLGLQTISPLSWSTNRLADFLLHSPLHPVFSMGEGEVEVLEITTPPHFIGRTVKDVEIPGELMIVALTHRDQVALPKPTTVFESGDTVHVCVARSAVNRLNQLLGWT